MNFPIINKFQSEIHINQKKTKIKNCKNIIYNLKIKSNQFEKIKKLKILHLSDTHFKNKKDLKKEYNILSKIIKEENFDLIFHTGDIIDKNIEEFEIEFKEFLKNIKSKYGKFYILGNHDYYSNQTEKLNKIMKKTNFINLTNSNLNIKINEKNSINLIGLDDNYKGNPNFKKATKNIKEEEFNILLTHNIDALLPSQTKFFNIILSGHLHAGEFNFGLFDGITILKIIKHYKNTHKQTKGFKFLSKKTISFIHPGNFCGICQYKISRIFTQKPGIVILEF